MKKLIKYLSIIIVVIAISATVYVKTSTNQTVQMQNKEALANVQKVVIPCHIQFDRCSWTDVSGYSHSASFYRIDSN